MEEKEWRDEWCHLKWEHISLALTQFPPCCRKACLLMWRGNCFANGDRAMRFACRLYFFFNCMQATNAVNELLKRESTCFFCRCPGTLGDQCNSYLKWCLCLCAECSRPARGELLSRDVQAGSPVRVPLHWTGLLEGSHHRRRARHHSRLHHDNWNLLQGNTRRAER